MLLELTEDRTGLHVCWCQIAHKFLGLFGRWASSLTRSAPSDRKNAYRDFVEVRFERFEFLPYLFDIIEWDLDCTVINLSQRVHLLLFFPCRSALEQCVGICRIRARNRRTSPDFKN